MRSGGLRIARIYGIDIRLHYSWFIIFLLIAWSFSAQLVPALYPDLSGVTAFIVGMVATLLFFLSVVLHELGHSIYAKRQGLDIQTITLFVFGGAAELREEPHTPRQEFLMAAAGPAVSIGLAAVFALVWFIGLGINYQPLAATGSILSVVNLMLGLFNLLPGFPLDGGRILRAATWKRTGSLMRATDIASTGGKVIAFLLMFYGAFQLLVGGIFGGLWLALIGYFLYRAAITSRELTIIRIALQDKQVRDIMQTDFVAAPGDISVNDFLRDYVMKYGQTSFPVSPGKRPAGMVFLEQVQEESPQRRIDSLSQTKEQLGPDEPALAGFYKMSRSGETKLPVTDNGRLVGVLSLQHLRSYINAAAQRSRSRV